RDDGAIEIHPAVEEEGERALPARSSDRRPPRKIFPYGVSFTRLERAVRSLGLPTVVTPHLRDAEAVLALRGQEQKNPPKLAEARRRGLPILTIRSNTRPQIEQQLARLFSVE